MCFTLLNSTVSAAVLNYIYYNGNSNTSGNAPSRVLFYGPQWVDGETGVWAQVSGPGTLAKTGYTFTGWNTNAAGTGTAYSVNQWVKVPSHQELRHIIIDFYVTVYDDLNLYAQWAPTPYTVTFNAHNSTTNVDVVGSIESPVSKPSDPSKTGYTFDDWYTGVNGTGSAVTFPYTPTAATTLHANWTLNTYTVTFDSHNGTSTIGVSGSIESPVSKPSDPSKTGYTFDDWYTGANGTGSAVTFPFVPTEAITLHANWTINQYTMTFNVAGGSAVAPITQNYLTQIAKPSDPTRTHYTFAGWYDSNNNPIVFPYTITNDITVVAKWNINSYTIMFDSAGGTNVTPIKQNYNTLVTKPSDPTNYGYTFSGWYTNAYGIGTPVSFPFTLTGNATLYARWTAGQYTLSFNTDGGSSVASVSGNYAYFISSIEAPTKAGYQFDGWYTGTDGTGNKVSFPYQIAGNATIYAKWKKVAATSDVSVPAVSSAPATPSITSTPPSASVPQMGAQGTTSFAITGIALFILLVSGLAVMTPFKMRKKESK